MLGVPVWFEHNQVQLLVDTGSIVTALTPEAVTRVGLDRQRFTGQRRIFTAAGTSETLPTGRVASLKLGGAELRGVEVALLDLPSGLRIDGLLGLNVLERFRVTFEFRRAALVLRPERAP